MSRTESKPGLISKETFNGATFMDSFWRVVVCIVIAEAYIRGTGFAPWALTMGDLNIVGGHFDSLSFLESGRQFINYVRRRPAEVRVERRFR